MTIKKMMTLFGIVSILICIGTWAIEWSGLVEPCVYCRTERTVIGILGVLMLLPNISYLTPLLAGIFGFFGAYVAADQVFSYMVEGKFTLMIWLAAFANIIIITQVFALIFASNKNNLHKFFPNPSDRDID